MVFHRKVMLIAGCGLPITFVAETYLSKRIFRQNSLKLFSSSYSISLVNILISLTDSIFPYNLKYLLRTAPQNISVFYIYAIRITPKHKANAISISF